MLPRPCAFAYVLAGRRDKALGVRTCVGRAYTNLGSVAKSRDSGYGRLEAVGIRLHICFCRRLVVGTTHTYTEGP